MEEIKSIDLKIPNLGDAEETEIIEVNIKVGDKISLNDPLIVLESEKAAMEVPSDHAGEVKELFVSEGESVSEGQIFAKIAVNENGATDTKPDTDEKDDTKQNIDEPEIEVSTNKKTFIDFSGINAGPAVRKYARELEIDLKKILGTGRNSRITKDDLKNFIHSKSVSAIAPSLPTESDFSDLGNYEIKKLSKIRQLGARNLASSWTSIPHVTHFEEMEMTSVNKARSETSYSPLAYIVKCIANLLCEFKQFNSSLIENNQILLKDYVNIGIAVDTEAGLVVPVIKDADKLTVSEINNSIKDFANKAQQKKLLNSDLSGATFTVSSLGKIGGIGFTPIINPPEVAIIGISRSKKQIKLVNGEISEFDLLPLSLSYDHRVINGADAGRFMDNLKTMIENYT